MRQFAGVLGVVLVFGVVGLVNGEQITFHFTGVVASEDYDHLSTGISVGDSFSGTWTYDTSAIDGDPDPKVGRYEYSPAGNNGIVLTLPATGITFLTNPAGYHGLTFHNGLLEDSIGTSAAGYIATGIVLDAVATGIYYQDSTATAFADDSLQASLQLEDFDSGGVPLWGRYGGDDFSFTGHLTSLTRGEPVPAPSTLIGLLSIGLMGLVIASRRRRAKVV